MRSARSYMFLIIGSLAGLVLVAIVAALLLMQQEASEEAPSKSRSMVKESAPDFTRGLLDGGRLGYGEVKGRPVLINFFASWCLPCREEMPAIEKIAREYRPKGIVFLGVAVDDTEAKMRDFVRRYEDTFPLGLDAGAGMQKYFGGE